MRYVLMMTLVLAGCEMASGPVCLDCTPAGDAPVAVLPGEGEVTAEALPAGEPVRATIDGNPVTGAPIAASAVVTGAPVAAVAAGALGSVVASLGDPARKGLWLETALVTTQTKGRVALADGKSVDVDLIPVVGAAGSGGRLSIEAYKALGLKITELPVLTVSSL